MKGLTHFTRYRWVCWNSVYVLALCSIAEPPLRPSLCIKVEYYIQSIFRFVSYHMIHVVYIIKVGSTFAWRPLIVLLNICAHLSRSLYTTQLVHARRYAAHREWIARRKVVKRWLGGQSADHRPSVTVTLATTLARQNLLLLPSYWQPSHHQLRRICETRKFKLIRGGIDRKVQLLHGSIHFHDICFRSYSRAINTVTWPDMCWPRRKVGWTGEVRTTHPLNLGTP